jgi:hypothetical protein
MAEKGKTKSGFMPNPNDINAELLKLAGVILAHFYFFLVKTREKYVSATKKPMKSSECA